MTKLLVLLTLVLSSTNAMAGADCQYRIAGADPITVTPSGITGKMSCSKKQIEELVGTVAKGMTEAKANDAVVSIGDLNSFWSVRSDLAKALAASKEWDSAKGAKVEGAQGVVTSELIPIFDPLFNKHGYRVASANLEQMGVEDASRQSFKGLKGKFPYAGKISLTITKSSY
ncbi:MAG: hypothetical protein AAB250_15445 [Bdellovibrionota bacterium]